MIDPAALIQKFALWRAEHAARCMVTRPVGGTADFAVSAAFERGQYNGMVLAEQFVAELMKDEKEDD